MAKINVKFKKLADDAVLPKYAHDGDLGMDVVANELEYDGETDTYIYYTGLACETKKGVGILLFPRSSNSKTDCYLTNSIGLVDSATYRGNIQFRYKNRTSLNARIELETTNIWHNLPWYKKLFISYNDIREQVKQHHMLTAYQHAPYQVGDKVGQLVVCEFPGANVKQTKKLSETERGEGGFGSTGK